MVWPVHSIRLQPKHGHQIFLIGFVGRRQAVARRPVASGAFSCFVVFNVVVEIAENLLNPISSGIPRSIPPY
jgi:hypothetical protein